MAGLQGGLGCRAAVAFQTELVQQCAGMPWMKKQHPDAALSRTHACHIHPCHPPPQHPPLSPTPATSTAAKSKTYHSPLPRPPHHIHMRQSLNTATLTDSTTPRPDTTFVYTAPTPATSTTPHWYTNLMYTAPTSVRHITTPRLCTHLISSTSNPTLPPAPHEHPQRPFIDIALSPLLHSTHPIHLGPSPALHPYMPR